MTKRPVTTHDVAVAAKVNQSTVSRALRGDPSISEERRKKILKMAKDLGYRPNPYVSAFTSQIRTHRRMNRSATIAVIDCWPLQMQQQDWMVGYFKGVQKRAESLGFDVRRLSLAGCEHPADELTAMVRDRRRSAVCSDRR